MSAPLLQLDHASVTLGRVSALRNISWQLRRGENWAILGSNGAGKSTFLRLIRGEQWQDPDGIGQRWFALSGKPTKSPIGISKHMALVSAEQQQRYMRKRWDLTCWDIVFSGLFDSELLYHHPTPAQKRKVNAIMKSLGIYDLASADYRKLSQGQMRKVLIARAMIAKPKIMVLDEVGVGLDAHSRQHVMQTVEQAAQSGAQILMTTHRRDELLPFITHVLLLRNGAAVWQGTREEYEHSHARASHLPPTVSHVASAIHKAKSQKHETQFLLDLKNVSATAEIYGALVLHDVTWRMNVGEHWMIVGDNGAGKTTLLKLILGELWHAQGGTLRRFGRSEFDDIWEIKKKIGFVSADLQGRYDHDISVRDVIGSGFFASVGWLQPLTRAQKQRINEIIARLRLDDLAERSILRVSFGQARKVLIARALVNQPKLLILDEVFDGLDVDVRAELSDLFIQIAHETSIILVSHHEQDRLPCITHQMTLRDGRVTEAMTLSSPPFQGGGLDAKNRINHV